MYFESTSFPAIIMMLNHFNGMIKKKEFIKFFLAKMLYRNTLAIGLVLMDSEEKKLLQFLGHVM